ncbi:HET-domain-containing protein [Daldinia sp. FL1419]|nr:HET-domain-containing protein [Daldinia sp. FL1419]
MHLKDLARTPTTVETPRERKLIEYQVWKRPVPIIQLSPPPPDRSGARACSCVWNGNFAYFFTGRRHEERGECPRCQFLRAAVDAESVLELLPTGFPGPLSLYTEKYSTPLNLDGTPFAEFEHSAKFTKTKWIYKDQLFQSSLKWAQDKIANCLNSEESTHQLCRRQSGEDRPFTPLRLINVNRPDLEGDVVLESGIPSSSYVALSYCWGNYEPECITTEGSLEENMQRIPWTKLPRTFRDAVEFTRGLGIQYLWIDSVCIIQDNDEDWRQQAGQMWNIYKYSYVTLAALYGSSSKSGLRSTSVESEHVKVAELSLDGYRCPIYRRLPHYLQNVRVGGRVTRRDIHRMLPLLPRAWAFQERMVSPRILYFLESEIMFHCFSEHACECGEEGCPYEARAKGQYMRIIREFEENVKKAQTLNKEVDLNDRTWQVLASLWRKNIVESYSGLLLTQPRDKLFALGAMANQFQQLRPRETYLAGLWSGSLIVDLCWVCNNWLWDGNVPSKKEALRRPYSLPTWSWASLQFGIRFPEHPPDIERIYSAEVLEAWCSYHSYGSFGSPNNSVLRLRSRLIPCMVKWCEDVTCKILVSRDGEWIDPHESLGKLVRVDLLAGVFMDCDNEGYRCIPPEQDAYLLEMMSDTLLGRHGWFGGELPPFGKGVLRYYLVLFREGVQETSS